MKMLLGMPFLLENGSIEDAAKLCAELNLDFVELNLTFPLCTPERLSVAHLRSLMEKYSIFFTFHLDETLSPCSFSSAVRAAWLSEICAALRIASEAGVPAVNMHWERGIHVTLPGGKKYLFESYRDEYLKHTLAFRDMCSVCADKHVQILIENTAGFLPFQQKAIELLLQSPCFGLTLDTGHDHCAHHADAAFYAAHADRLRHMHLHDALGDKCHLPLGTGELNIAALLNKAEKAQARVVLEIKTVEALRESAQYLSR